MPHDVVRRMVDDGAPAADAGGARAVPIWIWPANEQACARPDATRVAA